MNIKELVPPVELCKLIPPGEFADSAFFCEAEVGMASGKILNIRIIPRQRITTNPYVNRDLGREYHLYPAPTLQEIMAELNSLPGVLTPTAFIHQDTWTVNCAVDASGNLGGMITEDFMHDKDIENLDVKEAKDKNPATAALKLWLELKGIYV